MDTKATDTLMPLSMVDKYGLRTSMIIFENKDKWKINGLRGDTFIIGVLPDCPFTFGNMVIKKMNGVIDNGHFELLLGNDIGLGSSFPSYQLLSVLLPFYPFSF